MRGGPGEAQIELDRRMIAETIKRTRTASQGEASTANAAPPARTKRCFQYFLDRIHQCGEVHVVQCAGQGPAYAADQLFATLDTTTRQLYLGEAGRSVSLSDTVGFIRDLPHGLVNAFQATLQGGYRCRLAPARR